jgi:hypothetical protein
MYPTSPQGQGLEVVIRCKGGCPLRPENFPRPMIPRTLTCSFLALMAPSRAEPVHILDSHFDLCSFILLNLCYSTLGMFL